MHIPFRLPSAPLAATYRAWLATLRHEHINRHFFVESQPAIGCLWHDELFSGIAVRQDLPHIALVSPSRDGDYLSAVMRNLGFRVVRGSSSRGGTSALHEIITGLCKEGYGIGITVDGPRGPRHKAKPGALWLAVRSGRPIIPIRTYYSRPKVFASWDRFQLPLPFTSVRSVYGRPWYPDINPDDPSALSNACRELEERLNALSKDTPDDRQQTDAS